MFLSLYCLFSLCHPLCFSLFGVSLSLCPSLSSLFLFTVLSFSFCHPVILYLSLCHPPLSYIFTVSLFFFLFVVLCSQSLILSNFSFVSPLSFSSLSSVLWSSIVLSIFLFYSPPFCSSLSIKWKTERKDNREKERGRPEEEDQCGLARGGILVSTSLSLSICASHRSFEGIHLYKKRGDKKQLWKVELLYIWIPNTGWDYSKGKQCRKSEAEGIPNAVWRFVNIIYLYLLPKLIAK